MPDACQLIRDEILKLQATIAQLQDQLDPSPPQRKNLLLERIRRLKQLLTHTRQELDACEAGAVLPKTWARIYGSEINQGLRTYKLIAGKDTLVRVFIGASIIAQAPAIDPSLRKLLPKGDRARRGRGSRNPLTPGEILTPSFAIRPAAIDSAILHVNGPMGFGILRGL